MYFDYAATTPPHEEVLKTFETVNRDFWANPHALHKPGLRAESLLEQARKQTLNLLNAQKKYRCIFTSGATEANNFAIKETVRHLKRRGNHIITSAVEHPSVLEVFQFLKNEGVSVTILPVNESGTVERNLLEQSIRPETILVSIMHVNNEVGSINDLDQLGKIIKQKSEALFHVDACQSVGKMPTALDQSPIDLFTFSAHKFFGLKGSGALLLKNGINLSPLIHGGGQEFELRSGTADVARAVTMAKALRLSLDEHQTSLQRIIHFKKMVINTFDEIQGTQLNGSPTDSSPFIVNYSIEGISPETLLQALSKKGIYISTVSACSAHKQKQSHVVRALTGSQQRAKSSIRISLSSRTTEKEMDALCDTLTTTLETLRFNRK